MCVDRDRHPAGRRRGRRAARWRRWWWCSWWEAFDGTRGRRGGSSVHAHSSAVYAGQPAADGGSSSPDADGTAEHAHRSAQHAEHAAASHGDARWWHGGHGPAPGSKLPAAERRIAAAAESLPPLAAQRNRAATAFGSGAQYRVTSRARLDPPIGSGTRPRPGRSSRRSRSPRSGRWNRNDAAFAGSNARSSRFWPWLRCRARLGQQAGRRIRDEAGAAAGPDRRGWWWSTRCQHAAGPDRQPAWTPHDEAVVSESELPRRGRRDGRRQ
jgi:hypothetical protein